MVDNDNVEFDYDIKYCRQYEPTHKRIVIDFSEINWNAMVQLPSTLPGNENCDNEIESSSHFKSIDGDTAENGISQSASHPPKNNKM